MRSEIDRYTMSTVYEAIARILPAMGKDFKLDIAYANNQLSVDYVALTDMGRAIQPFIMSMLPYALKQIEKEHNERRTNDVRAGEAERADRAATGVQ